MYNFKEYYTSIYYTSEYIKVYNKSFFYGKFVKLNEGIERTEMIYRRLGDTSKEITMGPEGSTLYKDVSEIFDKIIMLEKDGKTTGQIIQFLENLIVEKCLLNRMFTDVVNDQNKTKCSSLSDFPVIFDSYTDDIITISRMGFEGKDRSVKIQYLKNGFLHVVENNNIWTESEYCSEYSTIVHGSKDFLGMKILTNEDLFDILCWHDPDLIIRRLVELKSETKDTLPVCLSFIIE